MIASIRGNITEIGHKYVVVETGGVGYKVNVTEDTIHLLSNKKECLFFTHHAIRENSQDLYGFLNKNEKDFFELLITVSSIGPKTALNILSLASCESLASAIRSGSTAHLIKVSGIGRKTAEKIVLELKDKLGGVSSELGMTMSSDMDAIEALKTLGYDNDDAREALKKINKDISDTGAKVKAALEILS